MHELAFGPRDLVLLHQDEKLAVPGHIGLVEPTQVLFRLPDGKANFRQHRPQQFVETPTPERDQPRMPGSQPRERGWGPGAQHTRAQPMRLSVLSRCVWRPGHVGMGRAMKIRNRAETVGRTKPISSPPADRDHKWRHTTDGYSRLWQSGDQLLSLIFSGLENCPGLSQRRRNTPARRVEKSSYCLIAFRDLGTKLLLAQRCGRRQIAQLCRLASKLYLQAGNSGLAVAKLYLQAGNSGLALVKLVPVRLPLVPLPYHSEGIRTHRRRFVIHRIVKLDSGHILA
jgi:hypothetical protein